MGSGRLARFLQCAALCALTCTPSLAQTTGALRGVVVDGKGDPLAGVSVTVASGTQGASGRGAVTDRAGAFLITSLPVAEGYSVRATIPGYASVVLSDVEVSAGRATPLRITLQPEGTLKERVEVRARPQVVDLEDAATATRFSSEFVQALPILGRNYQDILALAPGVSDVDGDGNPNIHGARDTDVVTLVDGVSTTDPLTGKVGAQLNIESIQEVELKTAGATAENGRAQGGFTNVITKSGGNEFQGTFKFFWRGSALDGDGAGIDDPRLHAGVGESGLRDLTFNDYLPFLSLAGPIVKDHAWFFMAHEYIQREDPVNALNLAFVEGAREFREFLKVTWQVSPSHRLALSVNYDPQKFLNQGLNSFTRQETGYTVEQGGLVLTLKGTSILSPVVSLETSVSSFDGKPTLDPNLGRDSNGDGVLYFDRNGNGFRDASERDPGEDYDFDGVFDVFEDLATKVPNHRLDPGEDLDGDGRLTPSSGCEGNGREDLDCDGHLDNVDEDLNGNGQFEPWYGEDVDGDRRYDRGIEDRNGNRRLDDALRPGGLYPYGELAPQTPDRDYLIDQSKGVVSGPYFLDLADRRKRFTFRQDLSIFLGTARGTHDLRLGLAAEREQFNRRTEAGDIIAVRRDTCFQSFRLGEDEEPVCDAQTETPTVKALLPVEPSVANSASGLTTALYVQDNYKPTPNLTIGLGLRFDREKTDSFGYTFFDPASERAPFDRLNALVGFEVGKDEQFLGNNDGLQSYGVASDPIFSGLGDVAAATAYLTEPMRAAALGRLTRHHSPIAFSSDLLQEVANGGQLDLQVLARFGIVPQQREKFSLTNNNLSPRLSFSWDPWSDGRTKLFATWGRYYDKLFLSTIVGEEGPDSLNRYYFFDPTGVDVQRTLADSRGNFVELGGTPNHYIGRTISKAPPSTTQVDRALQTPFSDELTLGIQREIAPEVALSLTYISRRFRDQLQDIDVNHAVRLDPGTGEPIDLLGNAIVTQGGSKIKIRDGRPDLYIRNPFFNQILRIGNFNEARYHAIEVELKRRLSRRWQMQGSYTYSRAVGDAEDFQSRLGNDPSSVESESGYLDYDQRHVVKVISMVYLPRDVQLGSSVSWASGLPYSIISRFFALDNVDYQQYRTRYGYTVVEPGGEPRFRREQRNNRRNDATYNIDLSLKKTFVVGRSTASAFMEVFNLLNTDDLHIFTYEPNKNTDPALLTLAGPLQVDGVRRFGRRFQVGVQFEF